MAHCSRSSSESLLPHFAYPKKESEIRGTPKMVQTKMILYFITGSEGKLAEARKILGDSVASIDLDLPEIQELDAKLVIKSKLEKAIKATRKKNIFCEDTAAYLDGMHGFPGPLIKWMHQAMGLEEFSRLCNQLDTNRVRIRSTIGYYNGADTHFFHGDIYGQVVPPRGNKDFGWGPIFQPDGYTQTFGEMEREEKNAISMRAIAFGKFKEYLNNNQ